jgi:hypothetical protein
MILGKPRPQRFNTPWASSDIEKLRQLANENLPVRIIADKLRRTEAAILLKAKSEKIALKACKFR